MVTITRYAVGLFCAMQLAIVAVAGTPDTAMAKTPTPTPGPICLPKNHAGVCTVSGAPGAFRSCVDYATMRDYLRRRTSPLGDDPELEGLVAYGLSYDVDPRIMVAISGRELNYGNARTRAGGLFPAQQRNGLFGLRQSGPNWAGQWPLYTDYVQGIADDACTLHFNFINDCYQRYTPNALLQGLYCDWKSDPKCNGWDVDVKNKYMSFGATEGDDLTYPGMCVFGDCNNDGEVTVDELITLVDIDLAGTVASTAAMDMTVGRAATDNACLNGVDPATGAVGIEDIIHALDVSLNGPPPPPPPPPTPLPPDQEPLSQIELDDPSEARFTATPDEPTPTPEPPDPCASCMCADCEFGGCYDNDGLPCAVCDTCEPPTEPPTPEPTATPGKGCVFTVSPTAINSFDYVNIEFDVFPPIPQTPGGFYLEFYVNGDLLAEDFETTQAANIETTAMAQVQLWVNCPAYEDPTIVRLGARVVNPSQTAVLCSDAVDVAVYENGTCGFGGAASSAAPGTKRVNAAHFKKTITNK